VDPSVFHLIGLPGTGKYTVARAMERLATREGQRLVVVDNHHINNPILSLVDADGKTPLPRVVWDRVAEVGEAVVRTIETLSPRSWSFVFTNYLRDDLEPDRAWFARIAALATSRESRFLPVQLVCDVNELCRRVQIPERRHRLKMIDSDGVRALAESVQLLVPATPYLSLDITDLPPEQAARTILNQ
jgi:hypothetical protein